MGPDRAEQQRGQQASVEEWIFGAGGERRFTQDSSVLPAVWLRFSADPNSRQDLLLTPDKDHTAGELMAALAGRIRPKSRPDVGLAYNKGYVVAWLDFHELVRDVVPLSAWWSEIWPPRAKRRTDRLAWYLGLVGRIEAGRREDEPQPEGDDADRHYELLGKRLLDDVGAGSAGDAPLWNVNVNREARTALWRSRVAVKADAATRVFSARCAHLRWAIVDTGVDAAHPAFRRRKPNGALLPGKGKAAANSRVVATYDFTRLRPIVSGRLGDLDREKRQEITRRIEKGRAIDWSELEPLLRVPHDAAYEAPVQSHGTHIAGIVGGDWRQGDTGMPATHDLVGICPDIELYDVRVFDEQGRSEEFAITAALQFIRYLNAHSDMQVVHGANLSLSIDHDLINYAVGRTPVCDECERLTASGVAVVAAAGNEGQATYISPAGQRQDGFRTVGITDPGNAERVITVGSTHRERPHTYGVSYFSSRGLTGDGRAKPDLVAPGEKIEAPVPGDDFGIKDGTSQATAHVSGVAAMLMARHPELVGQPEQVKRVLCASATDLGRERQFQGAGLVDALRALQEV